MALYYQFGRYLLLSSSRPGGQPANLQGIWNQDLWPAWSSKWTININAEMNYWAAETANLPECHEPLFDLIDDLRVAGQKTAREWYGCRGFVAHHNTDLWRGTAPVDGSWGLWPMGGVWLVQHLWEHYTFSGDREFLRQRAYPAMKESAQFVLDFLTEAPEGTAFPGALVTNPSYSAGEFLSASQRRWWLPDLCGHHGLLPASPQALGSQAKHPACAPAVGLRWIASGGSGRLTEATIRSQHGGACRVCYRDKMMTLDTKAGQGVRLNGELKP